MTEEQIILSKRAVACKGWRWMPGMRCVRNDGLSYVVVCAVSATKVEPTWLPDLADPATLGCLLALVRKAWGADFIDVVCEQANDLEDGGYVWRVNLPWGKDTRGATEAEALVAALEGAP